MRVAFISLLLILLISGCSSVAITSRAALDFSPAPSVDRAESLRIAEAYRTHRWRPTEKNIFHGNDASGIQVDTPDVSYKPEGRRPGWWVPNRNNEGIPYQWGGFDTPAEFDSKLSEGKAAGDIYSDSKRALLDDAVSAESCGIDCSGFVSRCWRLERSYSTRELAGLCDELDSFDDLEPGDIVNLHNAHVLLFAGWRDGKHEFFDAYETGSPPSWKVLRHAIDVAYVKGLGYKPFRYKSMRDTS